MTEAIKPEPMTEDHLIYLDALRDSGVTNMFGAGPWLKRRFKALTVQEAQQILGYWMGTFESRHQAK